MKRQRSANKQMLEDHALLKDKEKKFETYLQKCRQDLDERNRTIDNQAKAIERLRPIVERFEKEMETGEDPSSFRRSSNSRIPMTSEVSKQTEGSMESVEIDEIVNENEQLAKDLGK